MNEEMDVTEMNFLKLKEAAELIGKSVSTIRNYIDEGYISCYRKGDAKAVCKEELLAFVEKSRYVSIFGYMDLDEGDSLRPLDSFNAIPLFSNPMKYETSHAYMVSCYGRIFNITSGIELSQSNAAHGYKQVSLNCYEKCFPARVHRLVAFVWCENGKNKAEVHHIDGIKENNRADNLIFLTVEEHNLADKMLAEAKRKKDFKDYNQYIECMRKDNECKEKNYAFLDARNGRSLDYLYISRQAYRDLKDGKYDSEHIPASEIRGEYSVIIK